jgi:hypothetical protein
VQGGSCGEFWDRWEIYGGYTYARPANPSDAFPNGFETIARGIFVPAGEVNATYYDFNQIVQNIWTDAKYMSGPTSASR